MTPSDGLSENEPMIGIRPPTKALLKDIESSATAAGGCDVARDC
jgi:hypothetical protein